MVSESRPGRFAAIEPDVPHRHHDAIEFPDGRNVLVTQLSEGQRVTVLQLLYRHDYSKDELMGWATG